MSVTCSVARHLALAGIALVGASKGLRLLRDSSDDDQPRDISESSSGEDPLARPSWQVAPGPFGRGDCLAEVNVDGETLLLVPPGVPLTPPELVRELMCWRFARAAHGQIVGGPEPLTEEEALQLAPGHEAWIWAQSRSDDDTLPPGDAHPEEVPWDGNEPALALLGALRVAVGSCASGACVAEPRHHPHPVEVAKAGAHAFSAFVGTRRRDAPVRELARAADQAQSKAEFHTRVDGIAVLIGYEALQDTLISLLFARAHSRSWRYTRRAFPTSGGVLAAAIDSASSPHELRDTFWALEHTRDRDGVTELADILYERAHSRRWRQTRPVRLLLADPRFAPIRAHAHQLRAWLRRWLVAVRSR